MSELTLTLQTGDKRYRLVDEFGDEIGILKFNPSDFDIIKRYESVQEHFNNLKVSNDPTFAEIFEVTEDIKKQFDYLLNRDTSDLFSRCNPLSPLPDGSFYFVVVLEQIANIIAEETDKRLEASQKKISKAVADIINE